VFFRQYARAEKTNHQQIPVRSHPLTTVHIRPGMAAHIRCTVHQIANLRHKFTPRPTSQEANNLDSIYVNAGPLKSLCTRSISAFAQRIFLAEWKARDHSVFRKTPADPLLRQRVSQMAARLVLLSEVDHFFVTELTCIELGCQPVKEKSPKPSNNSPITNSSLCSPPRRLIHGLSSDNQRFTDAANECVTESPGYCPHRIPWFQQNYASEPHSHRAARTANRRYWE